MNRDPYKLALARSHGSFSRTISSYQPTLRWNKIKEQLCSNFGSEATKQHAASMVIDQQQKASKILKEYMQWFSGLLLKLSGLLLHQAKDVAHITHFMQNLHNQYLQHYIIGKNPTSVQNTITLAQKKDTELRIIKGLHNNDSGHKINNIYPKHNDKPFSIGLCHPCNGPHLTENCNESTCGRYKTNLNNHTPSKCPRKYPFSKQHSSNPFHNTL